MVEGSVNRPALDYCRRDTAYGDRKPLCDGANHTCAFFMLASPLNGIWSLDLPGFFFTCTAGDLCCGWLRDCDALLFFLGWSVWAALLPGALVAVVFSILIGLACLRLSGVYVALLTLAVTQVMYLLIVTDTECFIQVGSVCRQLTGGPGGFSRFGDFGTRALLRGKWIIGNYAIVCTLFVIIMTVTWILIKSRWATPFALFETIQAMQLRAASIVFACNCWFSGFRRFFYRSCRRGSMPRIFKLSGQQSCNFRH